MKLYKMIVNRVTMVALAIIVQVAWLFMFLFRLKLYFVPISALLSVLSLLVIVRIINKRDNPAFKLAWIVPIMAVPFFGGVIYLLTGGKLPTKKLRKSIEESARITEPYYQNNEEALEEIDNINPYIAGQCRYIANQGFPIYKNTKAEYYPLGEECYRVMLQELNKAKHFIFMEYFILEEGEMWDAILEILARKAKEGLDVRLIYDDVGSLNVLPYQYDKKMEALGIKCIAFNPFIPVFSAAMNYRDHRKITVIDGHTAFTGGINLADEYINKKSRFGHWKDNGVMLKGEAVRSFTLLFLTMWNAFRKTDENLQRFMPDPSDYEIVDSEGYFAPYGDSPMDSEIIGENVYLNIINNAKKYLYIYTPYLIVDHEMMSALCRASKRGVDVRIITPGIPDKKIVYQLTRSHYPELMDNGIKIYEYSPGFLHGKCYVCDDEIATVGTINMDYRSLYLHFECGCFFYKSTVVAQVKEDFESTLNSCRPIHLEHRDQGIIMDIYYAFLRLFSPLL